MGFWVVIFYHQLQSNLVHFCYPLQSLRQREFCLIYLERSNRKVLKLAQFPASTRRHVHELVAWVLCFKWLYMKILVMWYHIFKGKTLLEFCITILSLIDYFCGFVTEFSLVIMFLLFQKPEEGSISHRVQRLAKYRFLKVHFLFLLCLLVYWLFLVLITKTVCDLL